MDIDQPNTSSQVPAAIEDQQAASVPIDSTQQAANDQPTSSTSSEIPTEDGDQPVASTSTTLTQQIAVTLQSLKTEPGLLAEDASSAAVTIFATEQRIALTFQNIKAERDPPPSEAQQSVQNPAQAQVAQHPPMPPTAYLLICRICQNPAKNRRPTVSRSCGHVYCYPCITERIKHLPSCPVCMTPIVAHQSLKKLDLEPYMF